MKELYGIDMEKKQYSKLISSIPEPDISISMGCDVGCPFIGRAFDDNWKLEDPTGKTDDDFRGVIQQIEKNILELKKNDCNINSSLSIQSSKNAVFSRLFAYLMFKPYVFSLVFALMSRNKGNFFILRRLLYPSALRKYASLPL